MEFSDGERALGAPGQAGGLFQGEGEQRGGQGDRGNARTTESVIQSNRAWKNMNEVMKREIPHSIQYEQMVLKTI